MTHKKSIKSEKPKPRARLSTALYAIIAMYFFFMILDRLLSVIFGFNFQPYGPDVPPGFTVWGHLFNGSLALFGVWAWLKSLDIAGHREHRWVLRAVVSAAFWALFLWIPYNNDAAHLISHGSGSAIPLYMIANAGYVVGAGVVILRLFTSTKWRLVFLVGLFSALLFVHFALYSPMFPQFRWT